MDHHPRGRRLTALGILVILVLLALVTGAPVAIAIEATFDMLRGPFG